MQHKTTTSILFGILLFFVILIYLLSKISFFQGINGGITFFITPAQHSLFSLFHASPNSSQLSSLTQQNQLLNKQLAGQKKLIAENNALKDQFQTNKPSSAILLPAQIVGAPGFVPGISQPEELILNVGSQDGVKKGQAVVVNNNLVGSVIRVSYSLAVVIPLQKETHPFTARTLDTNANGLVVVDSDGVRMDNVLLSDILKKGDMVVTKGDINEQGEGMLPDIVVGKIVSVDKKSSALFQSAKVQSLVELSTLTTVFVISYSK